MRTARDVLEHTIKQISSRNQRFLIRSQLYARVSSITTTSSVRCSILPFRFYAKYPKDGCVNVFRPDIESPAGIIEVLFGGLKVFVDNSD